MKRFILTLCLVLFATPWVLGEDAFRTFTSSDGKEIKAKLLEFDGSRVKLEMENGAIVNNVSFELFSAKDRGYIREWKVNEQLKSGMGLEFTIFQRAEDRKNHKNSIGGKADRDLIYFEMPLRNRTSFDVDGLLVKYVIYWRDEVLASDPDEPGELIKVPGKIKIENLAPNETNKMTTESVVISTDTLADNYFFTNGGKRVAKDKMEGIWVRIYRNDQLLIETARPEFIMKRYEWQEP